MESERLSSVFLSKLKPEEEGLTGDQRSAGQQNNTSLPGLLGPKARGRDWAAQGDFIFLSAAFPEALAGQDVDNLGADLGYCLQAEAFGMGWASSKSQMPRM